MQRWWVKWAISPVACLVAITAAAQTPQQAAVFATIDPIFAASLRDNHIAGMVYGVVVDGRLVYLRTLGVQDTKTQAPVTADTVFRIASMSKNFTALAALKLRDQGLLSFDAPAERYVPELKSLRYPTTDSPKITVQDLLTHNAGFVTDDPWGDRQLDMSPAAFSALLKNGLPFSRSPELALEYSNLGYALVGRIVTNLSKQYYSDYIEQVLLRPLGMTATTYDYRRVPAARRAIGYRWEDNAFVEEPVLGPGEFGAMGGLMTSANDYARYMAWVLSAWPARDGAEDGIVRRASVRELARSQTHTSTVAQPGVNCPRVVSYSYGMRPITDCVLGLYFSHSGGLPGYGSNVVFLPERGIGLFAFANQTYAPMAGAVREAAFKLVQSQAFPARAVPVSEALQAAAAAVQQIYASGNILAGDVLAPNVLLDRDVAHRNADIAAKKRTAGACATPAVVRAETSLVATLEYACASGTVKVRVILAPTPAMRLQTMEFID